MRNWNYWVNVSIISLSSRFYSTYEELKLLNTISFVIDRIGFYSTYEELKPVSSQYSL